jgi:hypothetical protein
MSLDQLHNEWLSLIEISGPFLAVPVLKEVFPQGLEELDGIKRKRLRQAYEEWREAWESDDPQFPDLHRAWIEEVLARGLELDEDGRGDVLRISDRLPQSLRVALPEHGVTVTPDMAVVDEQQGEKALLLIHIYPAEVDLETTSRQDGWAASPAERMVQLCRQTGCRLGIATNGERWMLIDAPVGAVTTFASWYARLWSQEPITLQAFVHLLGIRRFFFDTSEQLPALIDRSLKFQDEVTDALGEQVRRAVEVLIQSLDKADLDRNRELLREVAPTELYEAGLTVMMRLVFLLSAEERGLLLLGDERYEAHYALSTLRLQLRAESEEILERRWDAWSRLLAIFRAVFGGIEHENLRMPALGGSLFNPDRFPFLEGRAKGSNWRTDAARPLPIDNRTVLLLLEAIQQFQGRTLSYRALDVEQIGYVYEGLLERTVKRTTEVTLELDATKSAKTPWITLGELESARLDGETQLAALIQDRSGCSASRVRNDLAKLVDDTLADRLLTACQADISLRDRIRPYAHLLRTDPWGYPLVYPTGAFIVTTGSDRRETGTHYTPKSLTEAIVAETLTPIAYLGPAEGKPREEWTLKSPAELLDLKICDPAMGSGAFLVQACRWLSDRLVEAWSLAESAGGFVTVEGKVSANAKDDEPLPRDAEARTVIARRLIAERCLYGVDLNPLAVELAKLSIWLVTLAKGRPFGFLDHNLRCGDSLLGIHRLDQLTQLSMNPSGHGQLRLFGQNIERAVREAIQLRSRLREMPIRDIHDIETMAQLDAKARHLLDIPEQVADAMIGEVFRLGGSNNALGNAFTSLALQAERYLNGDAASGKEIVRRSVDTLSTDLVAGRSRRRPFHWALEFPEVFTGESGGFHAITGNPPFIFGKNVSAKLGKAYNDYLKTANPDATSNVDICAHFFVRAFLLLRAKSPFGMLATSSIAEGETRQAGLDQIQKNHGQIYSARSKIKWPGNAAVFVSVVHVVKGAWEGNRILDGERVSFISPLLTAEEDWAVHPLQENKNLAYVGVIPNGEGLFLTDEEYSALTSEDVKNSEVLRPYITGSDLNATNQLKGRFIINFWDWSLDRARKYPSVLALVEQRVRPHRSKLSATKQKVKDKWWLFEASGKSLFHALGHSDQFEKKPDGPRGTLRTAIAIARVSKTGAFTLVPSGYVFAAEVVVVASDDLGLLATLQSSLHLVFAWNYAGKMKVDLRYSPTMCLETFPFPKISGSLREVGARYVVQRQHILDKREIGLTKLYNDFHKETKLDADLQTLRKMHSEMDAAVAAAYGWVDINLNHGFHEVPYLPENDRVRFTISEVARVEVLRRLSELNRQRYEEEVVRGLHPDTTPRASSRVSRTRRPASADFSQSALDLDVIPANEGQYLKVAEPRAQYQVAPAHSIVEYLKTHSGWHAKTDILAASGITDSQWNIAIAELMIKGFVDIQGDGSSARYRAKP